MVYPSRNEWNSGQLCIMSLHLILKGLLEDQTILTVRA